MFSRKQGNPQHEATRLQGALRTRLLFVKVSLVVLFILVGWRLAQIQIVDAPRYQEIARRQYEARMPLPSAKGNIYDRNGNVLVSNSMFISYAADPKVVDDAARKVAEEFSSVFGKPRKFYMEKLKTEKRFVWLERRVPPDIAKRVKIERLDGVVALEEPKRLYHYDTVAGQFLGFTDVDNRGLSGLELQFDKQLCGTDGYVVLQRDGLGNRKPSVDYPRVEPTAGADLHLTIDLAYQSIAEEELERGVKRSKAEGGLVAAINPRTGEILALAQYPGVDPNDVGKYGIENRKPRVVTDLFEPGSIFKVVTAGAALGAGLVKPDQVFFAENGEYKVPLRNGRIRLIKDTHEYGWITFQEAMELSSNIVMAKVSDIVGGERLYRMAKNFGFGSSTGVEVPGEIRGDLKKPSTWSATTLNTMAYGYEVGVTPIQILTAYGAVANSGVLLKPFILKKIVSANGETIEEKRPQVVRRAIPENVAQTLARFFEGVVERGTGTEAKIEGVRIAGKTGTSKKHINGRYQAGSYTASFVGFFPVDDPQVVCLVMVDNPRSGSYFGGQVSAPIFRSIAERLISTALHIPRSTRKGVLARTDSAAFHLLPDVRTLKVDIARKLLGLQALKTETIGAGEIVLRQFPEPGSRIEGGEVVSLFLTPREKPTAGAYVETPDLRGLTIRRAVNRLSMDKMLAKVNGSGIVTSQDPQPGEKIKAGTTVCLNCEPRRIAVAATQ